MESDQECGATWRGWLAKYDPDMSLWRTAQCSLLEDLNESLQTLPRSGMTRNGLLWEQPMLEQTTKEIASGLWPTPVSSDTSMRNTKYKQGGTSLSYAIQYWPTPDANCGQRGTQPKWIPVRKSGQPAQYTINQAVRDTDQSSGGKLNPMWVEWLMGWPLAWTDLKPLAMDKFHSVPQPLGDS